MKKTAIYLAASLLMLSGCNQQKSGTPPSAALPPVQNGQVSISYTKTGTADTALVFVHGWAINKGYWAAQDSFFNKRFTVVTVDLGGHGASGKNRGNWGVGEYAADVVAVIQALQLKKVILAGHSMSGNVALEAATRLPGTVAGIVGIDNFREITTAFSPQAQQEIDGFMRQMRTQFDSTAAGYTRGVLFPPGADSVPVNRVLSDIINGDSAIAIATMDSLIPATLREAQWFAAQQIPVHAIISGKASPANEATVRKFCKKGFFVKYIAGTGHYPMIERPAEFNRLLQETLEEIAGEK